MKWGSSVSWRNDYETNDVDEKNIEISRPWIFQQLARKTNHLFKTWTRRLTIIGICEVYNFSCQVDPVIIIWFRERNIIYLPMDIEFLHASDYY